MNSVRTASRIRPILLWALLLSGGAILVLPWFARILVVRDEIQSSDAIIVLLGDTDGDRTALAEELFRRGAAPRIAFGAEYRSLAWESGFKFGYVTVTGGARYRRVFLDAGIPDSALAVVPSADIYDTSSELTAIALFARTKGWRRVTLATSASHSRRCKIIWNRVAPDIEARVVGAPDRELEERGVWRSRHARAVVISEIGAFFKEGLRQIFASAVASPGETPVSSGGSR